MEEEIAELVQFLLPTARIDVKLVALQALLGFTGTKEYRLEICKNESLLKSLINLVTESNQLVADYALKLLINLSSDDEGVEILMKLSSPSVDEVVLKRTVTSGDEKLLDSLCKLTCNLSRPEFGSKNFVQSMTSTGITLDALIDVFCQNKAEVFPRAHYLAGLFANLSQTVEARSLLMSDEKRLLCRLLPFTSCVESEIRRQGVTDTIRNCCLDSEFHPWLLSEAVDILPHLLLPLAGPEEFPDDEMTQLPVELQFLGEEKKREVKPQIRKKLIEAITQLCASKQGREILREKQCYLILRELHKWEKDKSVLFALENVVQILIGDEPEPHLENLKDVAVPGDLAEKFQAEDDKFLRASPERETD